MKPQFITSVAAMGMSFVAATAFAQNIGGPTSPQDQQKLMNTPGYHVGTGAASVGGPTSAQEQQKLMNTPGYHVGTGAAEKNKQ